MYVDASIPGKPAVEVEFLQNGKSLAKVLMGLPDADAIPPDGYRDLRPRPAGHSSVSAWVAAVRLDCPSLKYQGLRM